MKRGMIIKINFSMKSKGKRGVRLVVLERGVRGVDGHRNRPDRRSRVLQSQFAAALHIDVRLAPGSVAGRCENRIALPLVEF